MNIDTCWYVIKTNRFKESYVKSQLIQVVGVEVYAPILRKPRRCVGPGRAQFEPLFPGYVFANMRLEIHLSPLRRLHSVNSLVAFDGRPAVVDSSVIDDLRRRERGRGYINLHPTWQAVSPDSPVEVVSGPFRGRTGVFVRYLDSSQRVQILLDALQASRAILEVPADAVAAKPAAGVPVRR